MLFAEGEPGDEFYIILKGAVKISKIENNQEVLLAVLRGGDIFGEMAMLERKPRTANAVAHEDCVVMVVNGGNFERTVREQPQIVARLTILQAERLWFIYQQLGAVLMKDPLGRMYEMLKIHLERNRVDLKSNGFYLFGFGPRELAGMAGLSPAESRPVLERFLGDKHISLVKDQIFADDLSEIVLQANYFKTMQKLDHSRRTRPGPR
jgi:CRP-like cAMP-binding protein